MAKEAIKIPRSTREVDKIKYKPNIVANPRPKPDEVRKNKTSKRNIEARYLQLQSNLCELENEQLSCY